MKGGVPSRALENHWENQKNTLLKVPTKIIFPSKKKKLVYSETPARVIRSEKLLAEK